MKIIGLKGKSNVGKTSSLKLLAKKFENSKYEKLIDYSIPNSEDKVYAFNDNNNKIIIGIVTRGDAGDDFILERHLEYFGNIKSDIIVVACRTSGATVENIEKLSNGKHMLINKCSLEGKKSENLEESMNILVSDWLFDNYYEIYKLL